MRWCNILQVQVPYHWSHAHLQNLSIVLHLLPHCWLHTDPHISLFRGFSSALKSINQIRTLWTSSSCSQVKRIGPVASHIISAYSKVELSLLWSERKTLASCWVFCGRRFRIRRGYRVSWSGISRCSISPSRGGAVIVVLLRIELRVFLHTFLHTPEVLHTFGPLYVLFAIVETRKRFLELLSTGAASHSTQTRAVPVYVPIG